MKQEDKELLFKDLCSRLPYNTIVSMAEGEIDFIECKIKWNKEELTLSLLHQIKEDGAWEFVKPYLCPMTSMTEVEAKEISILYGLKDILSTKITDEYIEVVVDDNVCSTEKRTIWYNEIVSSIEIFDWLNAHHFDYRGLIPKDLAIEVTEENNPYK